MSRTVYVTTHPYMNPNVVVTLGDSTTGGGGGGGCSAANSQPANTMLPALGSGLLRTS